MFSETHGSISIQVSQKEDIFQSVYEKDVI